MQQDSIHPQQLFRELPVIDELIIDDTEHAPHRPLTPYQVLRMLPRDATPAQQDSAIQAWFSPGEIHYSSQPDTLHLPGHGPGRSLKDVNLPQYYRENFFSNDSLYHPEVSRDRYGMAGDPVPYTIRGDNMFTALLFLSIIIFFVSVAQSQHFIGRQLKDFFFSRHDDQLLSETQGEIRLQIFFVLLGCLLAAISSYMYVIGYVADTFVLANDFQLVILLFACFVGYFLLKNLLYVSVNSVFFDGKRSLQFWHSVLFLSALEGALLFPAVLLQVYFDLSVQSVTNYYVILLVLVKMLTFYKSWVIFFRQNGIFFQNILYFCALEITPLLGFAGALLLMVDILKINF